jgi:hypothetical protein
MAEHFYDTSAAVKHYRNELGSARVDGFLADTASSHYLSTLGVVETHSVFARLVRTGSSRRLNHSDCLARPLSGRIRKEAMRGQHGGSRPGDGRERSGDGKDSG